MRTDIIQEIPQRIHSHDSILRVDPEPSPEHGRLVERNRRCWMTRCRTVFGVILLLVPASASAIGVMRSAIEGNVLGPMTLALVDVQVTIQDRLAITRVDQIFSNPSDDVVEGIYTFRLPPGAIITDLVLWIGDRRVQGQVLERFEARRTYDEIVGRRVDPALIEQIDDQTFTLSVFPFPANGSRRVELEYMEVLDLRNGVAEYAFPLAPEVREASVGEFRIAAEVQSQIPFDIAVAEDYASTTRIERSDDNTARLVFGDEDWTPVEDYVLRIEEREILLRPRVLSFPPTDDAMGYYVMWLPPVRELLDAAPFPRRVTFVIDKSGSMREKLVVGEDGQAEELAPLDAVKNALAEMLSALEPEDLFNVVVFSNDAEVFSPDLLPAEPDQVARAARFVRQQEAEGGTNFAAALRAAYTGLDPDEAHHVVFLTDGQTARSASNLSRLIDELVPAAQRIRLFTIGVGSGVERGFLRALSEANGGEAHFVSTEESIESELRVLFDVFSRPIMLTRSLDFEGTRVADMHPSGADVLAAGQELFQVGRYGDGGDINIRLEGSIEEEEVALDYPVHLAALGQALPVIPRLWAHQKVQTLEYLMAAGGGGELSDDILALGLEYRLVTSRTSLFALDDEVVVSPEPPPEEDFDFATAVEEESMLGVQSWLGRTFHLVDGVWMDQGYAGSMPILRPQHVDELPADLRPFAGLGFDLIVVDQGIAYQLTARGFQLQPVLMQNVPNPFNPTTTIPFVVPTGIGVETGHLKIFDVAGQLVWSEAVSVAPGAHEVVWKGVDANGVAVATGIYFLRLEIGELVATRRATLLR